MSPDRLFLRSTGRLTTLAIVAAVLSIAAAVPAVAAPIPAPRQGFPYAPKQADNAKCFLSVSGKVYIDGRCLYRPSGGGSFFFSDNRLQAFCAHRTNDCAMAELVIRHQGYFGSLDVNAAGIGEGHWNEGQGLHGQTPLGTLHRKGACWLSEAGVRRPVKLCVWK